MFTIQYTNDDGGRAVAMAMLPPRPTKRITLPWQSGFSGEEKKKSTLRHVLINCKKGATTENQGSGVKYMG